MKKHIPLKNSWIIVFLLVFVSGCFEEDCLDIEKLDQRTEEMKLWYVPDSMIHKTLVDTFGMSQTLTMTELNTHHWDDIVEDDCGNTYGSTYFSVQYNTSLSPLHFMVDIQGSGNDADGFYLQLRVTNTNSHKHQTSTYDFVTKECREKNARADILKQTNIGSTIYDTILKIEFEKTFSANDVKSVYYAQGTGLVKFELENGNVFWVDE
ncbi:MAG: hypothetical protein ACOCUQ_03310 [Bacteroidota bacterium]